MRKVIYSTNISIDGFCDHTYFMPDEEMMAYFTGLIQGADLLVYGRVTYELMVPYWPEVVKALTSAEKIVFSATLQHVEGNTQIICGNLESEIRKLKQQPGKNISVGGVDLPSQLIGNYSAP